MSPAEEERIRRRYRLLLRLFPRRFRRERGAAMERLVLDMARERRRRGAGTGLRFWLPLVGDTLVHALRARFTGPSVGPSSRTSSRAALMSSFATDLRYALRSLARQPFYAGMVILMIAVGIAGNTAVFRVFNGMFLRPLPFEGPEQLVDLDTRAPRWNLEYTAVAYADFHAWRAGTRAFQGMGVFTVRGANLAGDGEAVRVEVVRASHDLATVLGLEPRLGRLLTDEDDRVDGPRVALLTHGFWERQYGADESVVGTDVSLDGVPWEIVGVLPPEAAFVADAELWVPLQEDPDEHSNFFLSGVGRLQPGVTPEAAEEDLARIHQRLADRWDVNEVTSPVVSSLRERYLGDARTGSALLLGAVAVVLLIACANIAALTLARSLAREQEMGVRRAMGAGRGRIVRLLLTESFVLSVLGATAGGLTGVWASGWMVTGLRDQLPPWVTFDLDIRVLAFTVLVTVGATFLFGLAPVIRTVRNGERESLRAVGTRTTASRRGRRMMGLLVGGEVALASVLLILAGIGLRDLQALHAVDPGFRTDHVLTYDIQLPGGRYGTADERLAFWQEHVERVEALPGVVQAGGTTTLPLAGHSGWFFEVEDAPPPAEDEGNPVVLARAVTPGYIPTMDVRLLAGRNLNDFDGRSDDGWAAVVNESFVREFLSHRDEPVGARIRTHGSERWWTVVGVSRDTRHYGLDTPMRPAVYQPLRQLPINFLTVAVRTSLEPEALVAPIRGLLAEQDPGLAMFDVATMEERLNDSLRSRRAASWLIVAFSGVALLLAVAGIYGVISYGVRQHVREIGIRMALGAGRGRVATGVLRQGMVMAVCGMVVGTAAALAAAPLLSENLFAASPWDPVVYAGVVAVVLVVAGLANLLPARRAAGLDPMAVLRRE